MVHSGHIASRNRSGYAPGFILHLHALFDEDRRRDLLAEPLMQDIGGPRVPGFDLTTSADRIYKLGRPVALLRRRFAA